MLPQIEMRMLLDGPYNYAAIEFGFALYDTYDSHMTLEGLSSCWGFTRTNSIEPVRPQGALL